MASKVSNVLKVVGRNAKGIGSTMYSAGDGSHDGGKVNKNKRHKIRLALHKHRLRATGMTDDVYGSKESGGAFENKNEYED